MTHPYYISRLPLSGLKVEVEFNIIAGDDSTGLSEIPIIRHIAILDPVSKGHLVDIPTGKLFDAICQALDPWDLTTSTL